MFKRATEVWSNKNGTLTMELAEPELFWSVASETFVVDRNFCTA